nr:hypothetical protein [Tanacetum cinerariifolium]
MVTHLYQRELLMVLIKISSYICKEKLARKNELKARGTFMMALPNEHQLKFNSYKNARSLMKEIKKRFGGNKESKKTQKTLLKQQYENFSGSSLEGLDQTYDRLQKLIKETYLKWQMAMLTIRARRLLKKTERKLGSNGSETIGFDKTKVECYNCHKRGHFARECRAPREIRNREPVRRNVTVEIIDAKALVAQDRFGESVKQEDHNRKAKHPRKNSQSPRGNNTRKVNHQNSPRMSNPHPKRNFVPRAVLMRLGFKTLSTARQNSSRAVVSVNTTRQINTAYPRPTVNSARPVSNKKVNTVRAKHVNTARPKVNTGRPKAILNVVQGNLVNAVKASSC